MLSFSDVNVNEKHENAFIMLKLTMRNVMKILLVEVVLLNLEFILNGVYLVRAEPYSITLDPPDLTTIQGLSATFVCKVEGVTSSSEVEWQLNDDWISISNSKYRVTINGGQYTILISNVNEQDEGEYKCHVREGEKGTDSSKGVHLSVLQIPIPKFSSEPIDTTSVEGSSVSMPCRIEHFTDNALKILWVKDLNIISKNYEITSDNIQYSEDRARYSIVKAGVGVFDLKITNVSHNDSGRYYCHVTLKDRSSYSVTSRAAILSVTYLSCDVIPRREIYIEGEEIIVNCSTEGGRLQLDDYMFCSKIGKTKNESGIRPDRPHIHNTWTLSAYDNGGVIFCSIQAAGFTKGHPYKFGPINVHFLPMITINPPGDVIELQLNQFFSLECTGHGNPNNLDYRLLVNDSTINNFDSRYRIDSRGQILTIDQIKRKDDDLKITCIVKNSVGSSTITTKLKVTSMLVDDDRASHTSDTSIIVLVLSLAAAVLVIVVVIAVCVLCWRRRRRKMKADKNSNLRLRYFLEQDLTNRTNAGNQRDCNAEDHFEEFVQYEEIRA
ncbi:peroxidasin homolog [Glandiceps talaboti]